MTKKLEADFFQCEALTVSQTVTQSDDLTLAVAQRPQGRESYGRGASLGQRQRLGFQRFRRAASRRIGCPRS